MLLVRAPLRPSRTRLHTHASAMAKRTAETELGELDTTEKKKCACARTSRLLYPHDPSRKFYEAVRAAVVTEPNYPEYESLHLSTQPLILEYENRWGGTASRSVAWWPSTQAVGEKGLDVLDNTASGHRFRLMRIMHDLAAQRPLDEADTEFVCQTLGFGSVAALGPVKVMAWSRVHERDESDYYVHESRLSPFLFRYALRETNQ